jgi:hypothetical protein
VEGKNYVYHLMAAWSQEQGGFNQSKEFFDYVKNWNQQLQTPVKVTIR